MDLQQAINLIFVAVFFLLIGIAATVEVGRKISCNRERRSKAQPLEPSGGDLTPPKVCRFGRYIAVIRDADSDEPFISLLQLDR